jgi:SAM-dependent methyltransferase
MQGQLKDYQEQFHTGKVLGANVFAALGAAPGMRILDLGCGDGELTARISEAGAQVVGVDADAAFVRHAASLGLDARVMDGHNLQFSEEFDAVFSNASLHWMSADPAAVVRGVHRALRPGGRFVAEFGGSGNISELITALKRELSRRGLDAEERNPWFFPTVGQYTEILEASGLRVQSCQLVPAPTVLEKDLMGWLRTFCNRWLLGVDADTSAAILEAVNDSVAPALLDAEGKWTVPYVRLRVTATRPRTAEALEGVAEFCSSVEQRQA